MTDVPNLDCMDSSDLRKFYRVYRRPFRMRAGQLFPDKPNRYVRTAWDLAAYADNKATAQDCRARGDIQAAQTYEKICERIYSGLPDFAKW